MGQGENGRLALKKDPRAAPPATTKCAAAAATRLVAAHRTVRHRHRAAQSINSSPIPRKATKTAELTKIPCAAAAAVARLVVADRAAFNYQRPVLDKNAAAVAAVIAPLARAAATRLVVVNGTITNG